MLSKFKKLILRNRTSSKNGSRVLISKSELNWLKKEEKTLNKIRKIVCDED